MPYAVVSPDLFVLCLTRLFLGHEKLTCHLLLNGEETLFSQFETARIPLNFYYNICKPQRLRDFLCLATYTTPISDIIMPLHAPRVSSAHFRLKAFGRTVAVSTRSAGIVGVFLLQSVLGTAQTISCKGSDLGLADGVPADAVIPQHCEQLMLSRDDGWSQAEVTKFASGLKGHTGLRSLEMDGVLVRDSGAIVSVKL
jgi:hypothetical protein